MIYILKDYEGNQLGTIDDQSWTGSNPAMQDIADSRKANGRSLAGWNNGYIQAVPSKKEQT